MERTLRNRFERAVRLTQERVEHILRHPELQGQIDKLEAVLRKPDVIVKSLRDPDVHLYHKHYGESPVTEKYLLVAVKVKEPDAFIITAFFTDTVEPQGLTPVAPSTRFVGRNPPKRIPLRQGYGGYHPRIHPRVYTRGFLRRRVKAGEIIWEK